MSKLQGLYVGLEDRHKTGGAYIRVGEKSAVEEIIFSLLKEGRFSEAQIVASWRGKSRTSQRMLSRMKTLIENIQNGKNDVLRSVTSTCVEGPRETAVALFHNSVQTNCGLGNVGCKAATSADKARSWSGCRMKGWPKFEEIVKKPVGKMLLPTTEITMWLECFNNNVQPFLPADERKHVKVEVVLIFNNTIYTTVATCTQAHGLQHTPIEQRESVVGCHLDFDFKSCNLDRSVAHNRAKAVMDKFLLFDRFRKVKRGVEMSRVPLVNYATASDLATTFGLSFAGELQRFLQVNFATHEHSHGKLKMHLVVARDNSCSTFEFSFFF